MKKKITKSFSIFVMTAALFGAGFSLSDESAAAMYGYEEPKHPHELVVYFPPGIPIPNPFDDFWTIKP